VLSSSSSSSSFITPKAAHKVQYNLKVHWYNECKDKSTHTQTHTHKHAYTHGINGTLTRTHTRIYIRHTIKQHEQIYKRLSRSATAIEEHDWQT